MPRPRAFAWLGMFVMAAACSSSGGANNNANPNGLGNHLQPTDFSVPADLGTAADSATPTLTGCQGLNACIQGCADSACFNECEAHATPQAQMRWQAVGDCISTACDSPTADGGPTPCSNPSAPACSSCVTDAQTGACGAAVSACLSDGP